MVVADHQSPAVQAGLDKLHLKLRARDILDPEEEWVLRRSVAEVKTLPAGKTIVRAGVTVSECTCCSKAW